MDANGLRFWMLSEAEHWVRPGDPPAVYYDHDRRGLQLASKAASSPAATVPDSEIETIALSRLEKTPQTRDGYDTRAYWDATAQRVKATGALSDAISIFAPAFGDRVTDLAMGYDGVLYMAIAGRVVLQDRRGRWAPFTLAEPNFDAWRLAADPAGGVWALDRTHHQIARIQGMPLPLRGYAAAAEQFRACETNPNPPRLTILATTLPSDEKPVAIACNALGHLALLTWVNSADQVRAQLRCLNTQAAWTPPLILQGGRYAYSLAWVETDRIAVLTPDLPSEAPVYVVTRSPLPSDGLISPNYLLARFDLAQAASTDSVICRSHDMTHLEAIGDLYPLQPGGEGADHAADPFLHGITLPPYYPTPAGSAPLHHLSFPTFEPSGEAIAQFPLDSGSTSTVWHRLYLEAVIPAKCGIQISLAATDELSSPSAADWFEHRAGENFAPGEGVIPQAVWVPSPSELPYQPSLCTCAPEKNRVGLFTVLIQRANRAVRSLQGRYLWVKVTLSGDGRTTPELAAVRAYGSRFSYVGQYLPTLYHESRFGSDRDQIGSSTPADFLERFLSNFEGILTPLEDRIAHSYLLTDPRTTPEPALDWLGSWIGVTFDPAYPAARRRRLLEVAPELYRQRGTLQGLRQALDVVTGGAVTGGEIVVLEDFRLRRTFATILGADLADENDPLLGGLTVSGNSYVGDTLILGDEDRKEFLAVFNADLQLDESEAQAIATFFDKLAYRVTVLVHEAVEPQNLGLIRRVVELETPAHVEVRVATATYPFIVSIASLVGADTYLSRKPQPQPIKVGQSQIGIRDLIQRPASLDPRLEGGSTAYDLQQPIATLTIRASGSPPGTPSGNAVIEYGSSFQLDGSISQPAPGTTIARYIWTLIKQP